MNKKVLRGIILTLIMIISCIYGDKVYAANDSFTNATSISVNKAVTDRMAYSNTSDSNYYKFTITSPGYVNLSFSHAEQEYASNAWCITLYDSNQEEMHYMYSKKCETNVNSSNIGLSAGTYYIVVDNVRLSYSTIDYQLKVNYTASNSWETEGNGGFTIADTISVNQTINGSMMHEYTAEYDYYKFTLDAPGYISMSFDHVELESTMISWYIVLYDQNREVIKEMNSRQSQSSVRSNDIGLPAGTYYISINNEWNAESTVDYHLTVNYVASNSWETEFNNGFTTADTLLINEIMNGGMMSEHSTDCDFYKFTLSKAGYINFDFFLTQLPGSYAYIWNITLYDANRQVLKEKTVTGDKITDGFNMIYLPEDTYYVEVDNSTLAWSRSTINYQIKVYYTTPKANIKSVKSTASKKLTLKWKKLQGVTGYEIVTATNKKFNKNKKVTTINKAKKTSTTVKKLKRKKKYYVKMRGFVVVDGQKYYGPYSKVKKVKVK